MQSVQRYITLEFSKMPYEEKPCGFNGAGNLYVNPSKYSAHARFMMNIIHKFRIKI